jgi:hypothetical protein
MGDSNNDDRLLDHAVINSERKPVEEQPASSSLGEGVAIGRLAHSLNGKGQLA